MAIFDQKRSFLGGSGAPKCHFLGAKGVQTHPPRCEVQCSTMFNQCSTQLGSLGLPMAQYGIFWPKKGHFWGILGPQNGIFGGPKGSKLTPLDVKYNVQPCSTNVQSIWGCWDCLWPNMALFGQKMSFLGGSGTPKRHFLGAKRAQTHPPTCEVQCSTISSQCLTHLWSLGLPMAKYGNFGPKWP